MKILLLILLFYTPLSTPIYGAIIPPPTEKKSPKNTKIKKLKKWHRSEAIAKKKKDKKTRTLYLIIASIFILGALIIFLVGLFFPLPLVSLVLGFLLLAAGIGFLIGAIIIRKNLENERN